MAGCGGVWGGAAGRVGCGVVWGVGWVSWGGVEGRWRMGGGLLSGFWVQVWVGLTSN